MKRVVLFVALAALACKKGEQAAPSTATGYEKPSKKPSKKPDKVAPETEGTDDPEAETGDGEGSEEPVTVEGEDGVVRSNKPIAGTADPGGTATDGYEKPGKAIRALFEPAARGDAEGAADQFPPASEMAAAMACPDDEDPLYDRRGWTESLVTFIETQTKGEPAKMTAVEELRTVDLEVGGKAWNGGHCRMTKPGRLMHVKVHFETPDGVEHLRHLHVIQLDDKWWPIHHDGLD